MEGDDATLTSPINRRARAAPTPGVITVYAARQPVTQLTRAKGRMSLGRDRGCAIALADLELSRQHAELEHLGDGVWRITDLGTKNGTYVNGARVKGGAVEHQADPLVVRAGGSVLLLDDLGRFSVGVMSVGEYVISPRLQVAHDVVIHAARAGATVLVEGESGSGKDQLAALYRTSSRHAKGPLVAVNCSAIARHLAEAELFGVKKGAYTGADADRPGLFQQADKGVLFLDEVGTLDLDLQAKLLRVLEDKVVRLVGGVERKIDVLVIAATNRDLRKAVEEGAFRQDLFMRLSQEHVHLPPLRERREEIPYLLARAGLKVPPEFVEACLLHDWPGNVRELLKVVGSAARAALAAKDDTLSVDDLPARISRRDHAPEAEEPEAPQASGWRPPNEEPFAALCAAFERTGSVEGACEEAGVPRSTGYRWLKRGGRI